jgi:hypothetical protein
VEDDWCFNLIDFFIVEFLRRNFENYPEPLVWVDTKGSPATF